MPKNSVKMVLPPPMPKGLILTDIAKNKWCLGPSIGKGGFGEIYSAAEYSDSKKNLNYQYVVKIEPHDNGPLFCEMHFFMRNAKPDMIKSWCSEKKLSTIGIPRYLGSGSHEQNGCKYRFLVMDQYGKDLWHIFLENKKIFPVHTVFKLGLQLLDCLEYIHNNGYIHADLKGANILLGLTKQTQNQVFLVDYGLASKYTQKDFKPDPKKAHNGTIEYTSRDAHDGVPTRRSDLEILAYNMIQWMGCVLPWEKIKTNPVLVHSKKKENMENVSLFLKTCFGTRKPPGALMDFLQYVANMSYDSDPDYNKLRTIFKNGIKASGGSLTGPLEFKAVTKHKNDENVDSDTPEKKQKLSPRKRTPQSKISEEDVKTNSTNGRSKRGLKKIVENISDSESDAENTKPIKKTARKRVGSKIDNAINSDDDVPILNPPNTNGFTSEMLRLHKKIAERDSVKIKKSKTKSNGSVSHTNIAKNTTNDSLLDDIIDATPPEKLNPTRKKKIINTQSTDDSEDITPKGRKLRK